MWVRPSGSVVTVLTPMVRPSGSRRSSRRARRNCAARLPTRIENRTGAVSGPAGSVTVLASVDEASLQRLELEADLGGQVVAELREVRLGLLQLRARLVEIDAQ